MMKRMAPALVLLLTTAAAQPAATSLNLAAAESIASGCRSFAGAKGQSHGIAIVDAGGHLVIAVRMDGNREGVMAFAIEKAKASALWGFPTSAMAEVAKSTPGFARAPYVVTVAGGVPVYGPDGRTLIGAVGASGEDPADDAACAEAGIKVAGLASARK
jgi:uncharacterized protein GlcG (DUF336 family)